jgi:hypothetical protein
MAFKKDNPFGRRFQPGQSGNRLLHDSEEAVPHDIAGVLGANPAYIPQSDQIKQRATYSFTQLGVAFLNACRPPSPAE